MKSRISITYSVDGHDAEHWEDSVHESIMNILHNMLPYMVDNVSVAYISENDEDYDA